MDLKQYFDILWRRRWVIVFTVAATMVAVVATLRIAASAGGTLNYSEYVYAAQLTNTNINIVKDEQKAVPMSY